MKKLIVFTIIIVTAASLHAQDTTLTYDMINGFAPKWPGTIREGSSIGIKYTNINPFLFSSNAGFQEVNHNYNDGLAALQQGLGKITSAKSGTEASDSALDAANKAAKNNKKENNFMFMESNGRRAAVTKKEAPNVDTLLKQKVKELNNMRQTMLDISMAALTIRKIMVIDSLTKLAVADKNNYTAARMRNSILEPVSSLPINDIKDVDTLFQSKISYISVKLTDLHAHLNTLRNINTSIKQKIDVDDDGIEAQAADELKEMTDVVEGLDTTWSGENLRIMQFNIAVIAANFNKAISADYIIHSNVIGNATGDFIDISDQLKDKSGSVVLDIKPKRIKTYGGNRIDFSVGVAATFGPINGTDYSLRKNPNDSLTGPDTSKVVLHESTQNRQILFSPVIFVHFYQTHKSAINTMFSVGLAPDFSELGNTKLMLGASLGFTPTSQIMRRIVISGGLAAGYADVLKSKYEGWSNYERFGAIESSDLTEKALRVGFFTAVSFNLGGS